MKNDIRHLRTLYESAGTAASYDFGGAEGPFDDDTTVVDIVSAENFSAEGYPNPYIQADLNNPISLPPVTTINLTQTAKYVQNLPVLASNIQKALIPGGSVTIGDNYYNGIRSVYTLVDILTRNGFKISPDSQMCTPEELSEILSKVGVTDVKELTDEQADELDNMSDQGEIPSSELFITLTK